MRVKSKVAVKVKDLCIERGEAFTLRISQLQYPAGTIVCLAGANGSGKTTLVECLVGLLVPAQGEVRVGTQVVRPESITVKKQIGFVPDDDEWIVAELTADEYFALLIKIYRQAGVKVDMKQRLQALMTELMFKDTNVVLGELSHGNKKKVQIIAALLHQPALIVVDEVRNGLDPIVIKRVEKLLQKEAKSGATIIAATHDLWWAERFAKSVVFLNDGNIALAENKRAVLRSYGSLETGFESIFKKSGHMFRPTARRTA
jgi:ABC-2 type transport system ATP-binding protein